jgi:hypothetical protein
MSCNPLTHPACVVTKLIPPVTGTLTNGVLSGLAQAIDEGIRWIVVNTATWWIQVPSPNLTAESAVGRLQAWLLPITAAVAIGGVIAGGLRMALSRRANPLLDVTGGLLTLAATVTVGVVIPALLLRAGDAWSSWVLQISTGGHFTQRLAGVLGLGGRAAAAVVLILGIVAIILALVQAVLMLFRQVALVILAGVLPLAAAGSAAPLTKPWIRRVSSWMLALICYKPAAAAVYATAFTLIGSGRSPRTWLMGFVMLLLSVLALPVLLRFFSWTTGSIASSGGGGQILGMAAVGAYAVGAMRSGSGGGAGSAAQDQAAYTSSRLGPPPDGSPPSGSPGPFGPSGPNGPGGATPAPASASVSAGAPTGAAEAPTVSARAATGAASAGSAGTATSATASAGTATGAASGAATGAAAAAGPVGAAAALTMQAGQAATQAGARLADGAIGPEGER